MERPSTPKKRSRPRLPRSQSNNTESATPPQRGQAALRQALPSLHLHSRHHNSDRHKRHVERHAIAHAAVHVPANVTSALAEKFSSSRGTSSTGLTARDSMPRVYEKEAAPVKIATQLAKPIDVAKQRHRRIRRNDELRSTFDGLADLASNNTRKVDLLFMGLKERLRTLRNTVQKLQELAVQSTNVHKDFEYEANDIETEYRNHVDGFQGFEEQQQGLEALKGRIEASVRKSEALQGRLKIAADRVAEWEKREDEWQARTSMKLKIGWVCAGILAALLALGIILHAIYLRTSRRQIVATTLVNNTDLDWLWKRPPDRFKDSGQLADTFAINDTRLQIFDEL